MPFAKTVDSSRLSGRRGPAWKFPSRVGPRFFLVRDGDRRRRLISKLHIEAIRTNPNRPHENTDAPPPQPMVGAFTVEKRCF